MIQSPVVRPPQGGMIHPQLMHDPVTGDAPTFGQKKTPPVSGRRSNYAHLTEVNIPTLRHRSVKK